MAEYTEYQGTHSGSQIDSLLNKINSSEVYSSQEKTKLASLSNYDDTAVQADISSLQTSVAGKVDKVTGKGLSTNDYTTTEKTKLTNIEAEANKTVVDDSLKSNSSNPVANSVLYTALGNKVDKVSGKGLSTNDYTTSEKNKLAALENYDDTQVLSDIESLQSDMEGAAVALDNKVDKVSGKGLSTNDYTDTEKTKLAGLSNYDDTVIQAAVAGKVDKVTGKGLSTEDYTTADKTKLAGLSNYDDTAITTAVAGKVDKVTGKGLSTNDYTTTEKDKLAGLSNTKMYELGASIPSGSDLNSYTTPGVYYASSSSISQNILNNPCTTPFKLTVEEINNVGRVCQTIIPTNITGGIIYTRLYTNNGWQNWFKFTGEEIVPSDS